MLPGINQYKSNYLDSKEVFARVAMHMPLLYIQIIHANELWLFPHTIILSAPASMIFAYTN